MEARIQISGNERGAVLITALFVILLLTIIGIAATTTTTTDLQIAGNQKLHSMAFYAAEAGIEAGRVLLSDLKRSDSGNWDNLLAGNECDWTDANGNPVSAASVNNGDPEGMFINPVILAVRPDNYVGEARFRLWVRDNDDLDDNDEVDTDDVIVLTSIGEYSAGFLNKVRVQIETQVRYTGGGGQYAQEHYGTESSGVAARESETVAAEQRW